MGISVTIFLIILGFVLLIFSQKGAIDNRFLDNLSKIAGIVAMLAAVFVFVVPAANDWPSIVPTTAPNRTALSIPTPRTIGRVSLFDDFTSNRNWTEGSDLNGKSWYGDGGYNVTSYDRVSGWIWIMPKRIFSEGIIEVDATPITHGSVTGYGVVVGWEKGNTYYLFENHPNGQCGLLRFFNGSPSISDYMKQVCPLPVQGKTVRIRIEISGKNMIVFLDGRYVAERVFSDYHGGLIGFEAYNGGNMGSNVKAQIIFDNLSVWDTSLKN